MSSFCHVAYAISVLSYVTALTSYVMIIPAQKNDGYSHSQRHHNFRVQGQAPEETRAPPMYTARIGHKLRMTERHPHGPPAGKYLPQTPGVHQARNEYRATLVSGAHRGEP